MLHWSLSTSSSGTLLRGGVGKSPLSPTTSHFRDTWPDCWHIPEEAEARPSPYPSQNKVKAESRKPLGPHVNPSPPIFSWIISRPIGASASFFLIFIKARCNPINGNGPTARSQEKLASGLDQSLLASPDVFRLNTFSENMPRCFPVNFRQSPAHSSFKFLKGTICFDLIYA